MNQRKKVSKVKQFETERIVNLGEFEQLVRDARVNMSFLKKALKTGDKETAKHQAEQLDLKLHSMEAFEFVLERRIISKDITCGHQ